MNNNFSYVAPVSKENVARAIARKSAQPSESKPGDSVTSVSASANEDRAARVSGLKDQYQAGKYKVEPKEVSSKIIEKHLGI